MYYPRLNIFSIPYRQSLNNLLGPLLRLRQSCCHPQAVKGQFMSLQKSTMTMEVVLQFVYIFSAACLLILYILYVNKLVFVFLAGIDGANGQENYIGM